MWILTDYQLHKLDVPQHQKLRDLSTAVQLCQGLVKTNNLQAYYLINRLIRLPSTLPVSTTNAERAFSIIKIIKNEFCNKMKDEFLANCMVVYIERDIAETFDSNSIIEDFSALKNRQAQPQF